MRISVTKRSSTSTQTSQKFCLWATNSKYLFFLLHELCSARDEEEETALIRLRIHHMWVIAIEWYNCVFDTCASQINHELIVLQRPFAVRQVRSAHFSKSNFFVALNGSSIKYFFQLDSGSARFFAQLIVKNERNFVVARNSFCWRSKLITLNRFVYDWHFMKTILM